MTVAARRALPTQTEFQRIAKAMRAAGVDHYRIDLDPATGRTSVVVTPAAPPTGSTGWEDLE